jgi:hypothetical protein
MDLVRSIGENQQLRGGAGGKPTTVGANRKQALGLS